MIQLFEHSRKISQLESRQAIVSISLPCPIFLLGISSSLESKGCCVNSIGLISGFLPMDLKLSIHITMKPKVGVPTRIKCQRVQ